jgi:hypothetical protein
MELNLKEDGRELNSYVQKKNGQNGKILIIQIMMNLRLMCLL